MAFKKEKIQLILEHNNNDLDLPNKGVQTKESGGYFYTNLVENGITDLRVLVCKYCFLCLMI